MYFDDYSTSFQSLYRPMYNISTNYNANINGNNGAVGGGNNGGVSNNIANMGYMSPMMNIGIGQFGADQLLKNEDNLNNYYARPIATHKKKDELPAMLGILGTALGTAALLLASKGKIKFRKSPKTVKPVNPAPVSPRPVNPAPVQTTNLPLGLPAPKPGNVPNPPANIYPNPLGTNKPVNPTSTKPVNATGNGGNTPNVPAPIYNNPTIGQGAGNITGGSTPVQLSNGSITTGTGSNNLPLGLPAPRTGNTPNVPAPIYNNPVIQTGNNTAVNNLPLGLPAPNQGLTPNVPAAVASNAGVPAAINPTIIMPNNVKPYMTYAQYLRQNAVDVPFEEIGRTSLPATVSKAKTAAQAALPQPQGVKGYLPSQTSKQAAAKAKLNAAQNLPSSGIIYTTPANSVINNVNQNLADVNPQLVGKGSVVYTTHTPETLANGYSIGSTAKGADKLADLLNKMQG